MNVIVLNDHLNPDGGADVVALLSAEALAAAGAAVTLFVGDRHRDDDTRQFASRLVCTGQNDLLRSPRRAQVALQGLWNGAAARLLGEELRRHDPRDTVVHLHSWTKSLSASVVRRVLGAGFPLVLTLHDYFTACPNGTFWDYQRRQVCDRKPMSLDCMSTHCDARRYAHKVYRVVRQGVQQVAGLMPHGIREFIVVSRFSQRILAPYLPAGAHVQLVHNPIDVPPGPPADPAAHAAFVVVARLFAPKGQALFLEACERAGVQGVCVGEGPDLAALLARFPRARFTGQLDRAGVTAQMRAARSLVMPSHWPETQGLVVSEAAALGIPAIVADHCAGADAVQHGVTGLHVRSGDVADLAQALRTMADQPDLARRLGRAAYEHHWAAPPTNAAHAQALLNAYQQILCRHHASATAAPLPVAAARRTQE